MGNFKKIFTKCAAVAVAAIMIISSSTLPVIAAGESNNSSQAEQNDFSKEDLKSVLDNAVDDNWEKYDDKSEVLSHVFSDTTEMLDCESNDTLGGVSRTIFCITTIGDVFGGIVFVLFCCFCCFCIYMLQN